MMITKEQAIKFAEWFAETLEEEATATPCIYAYNGKIDFTTGSQAHGLAMPVHEGTADVIFDVDDYNEYAHDRTVEEIAEVIYERCEQYIEDERRG